MIFFAAYLLKQVLLVSMAMQVLTLHLIQMRGTADSTLIMQRQSLTCQMVMVYQYETVHPRQKGSAKYHTVGRMIRVQVSVRP
jgi:hypothetical protein